MIFAGMCLAIFQSTLPARGATWRCWEKEPTREISIHAPRTGSDGGGAGKKSRHAKFQSTLPARGATPRTGQSERWIRISIHAPRTGSDDYLCGLSDNPQDFNPRSPHGERRNPARHKRRAGHFNPRSPHGERQQSIQRYEQSWKFQSTLPARGATGLPRDYQFREAAFQSTLPARGATHSARKNRRKNSISIHAPRTGSDQRCRAVRKVGYLISIHAPRTGSDHGGGVLLVSLEIFQSTLPARGATEYRQALSQTQHNFNPRSPHGERPF